MRNQLTNTQVIVENLKQEQSFRRAKIAELSDILEAQAAAIKDNDGDSVKDSVEQHLL